MSRLYGKRKAVELYDPTEIDDLVGSIKHRIIEGLHPPRKQTEPVQVPEFSERTKAVLSALAQAEARKAAEKEQRQQADHRTQALLPSEATTQVNSGLAPGRASSFDAQQPEVILQSPESPVSQDHRSDLEDPESVVEEETEDEGEDDDAESPASDVNNNQPSSSRFVQTQEEWSGEDDGDDEDVQEVEDDEEDVRYGDHNGQRRSSPNEVTEQEYLFEEEDELEREDEKEEEGGGVSQGVSYLEDQENDAYASRLPTENTEEQVTWTVSNEGAISESQLGHEAVHAALAEVQNAYQELYQPNTDDLLTSAQIAQAWEELDPALRDATATAPVANEDVNPLSQPNQDDQQTRNISSGEILDQALRSSSVQSKAPSGESPAASDGGLQRPSLETSDARPTAFITSIDTDDQDQEDEDELEADETSENDGSEGRDESSGEEVSEGETSDGEASDDEDQVSSESDADVPSRSIDLVGARQQGIRPDEAEQIIEDDENSAQEVDLSDSDEYDSEEEEADDDITPLNADGSVADTSRQGSVPSDHQRTSNDSFTRNETAEEQESYDIDEGRQTHADSRPAGHDDYEVVDETEPHAMDDFEEAERSERAPTKTTEPPFKHVGEHAGEFRAGLWPGADYLPGVTRPGEWHKGTPVRFSEGRAGRASEGSSRSANAPPATKSPSSPQISGLPEPNLYPHDLLRHAHGGAQADHGTQMQRTSSQQSNGSSPHRSLRSNCHYHKIRFNNVGESGADFVILIPECSLQTDQVRARLDAQDLGLPTEQEARRRKPLHFGDQSLDHERAYHFGSPSHRVASDHILPEDLEHRLRQLVGADLLREGACWRLPGEGEPEDEGVEAEERHSRSLFANASPSQKRTASRSLSTSRQRSTRSSSRSCDPASRRSIGESFSARLDATAEAPSEEEQHEGDE